jgi:diacylglycerol kinase (ATP)
MRLLAVANPRAGRGRSERGLRALCRALQPQVQSLELASAASAEQVRELARAARGLDGLIVAGGDGMAHLAAQELAGSDTALALLPRGRGNDLARNLGLPTRPAELARVILQRRRRALDLLAAERGLILNVVSAGFDAEVNARANRMLWPRGRAVYPLAFVGALARLRLRRFRVQIDRRLVWDGPALTLVLANGPAYGGGIRIAPRAAMDDGQADVLLLLAASRWQLLRALPRVYRGAHLDHPAVRYWRGARVEIETKPPAPVYGDGEPLGLTPIVLELRSRALWVFADRPPCP